MDFFEVHLKSLTDFAWELEGQLEAVGPVRERVLALGDKQMPLGGFAQAQSLSAQHRLAASDMVLLLDSVRQALGFAAGVTRAIAMGYEEFDEQAAAWIPPSRT
jgi:hypothetical protein